MKDDKPFLLLRARPGAEAADRFAEWLRTVHLRDVRAIPGIVRVRAGRTPGGTWLGVYEFESAEAVPVALGSPQAAYARGTWEQWATSLDQLLIEMFAAVGPLPIYRERS